MRSVMQHEFGKVEGADIPRSSFNRSHTHKTVFDAGYLVPIYLDEAVPGDVFNLQLSAFARLATPLFPTLDNMFMDFFFFSIPNRLLWHSGTGSWRKFCGEQDDPGDSIAFTIPKLSATNINVQTADLIHDYMGQPWVPSLYGNETSALPYRAYNFVWNEWFRDQNLQDSVDFNTDDGPDTATTYTLLRRGKRHDYFTSCLPWPQKGDAVELSAEVRTPVGTGVEIGVYSDANAAYHRMSADTTDVKIDTNTTGAQAGYLYTNPTINEFRQAFQVQRLLERDARGGTRYAEIVMSHFQVEFQDVRYRPEYLGGGSIPINITPISATASRKAADDPDATDRKPGQLSGYGTAAGGGIGFTKAFTEHCTLLGLVSVRADLTYQQGQNRMWHRDTRYDFYWPALSHLGEQAVKNQEIWYTSGDTTTNNQTFGYNGRYDEYRHFPSRISGLFRSDNTGTLDPWHLSQDFATLPLLDDTFIQDNPPIDRIIATPSEPHFYFDSYFDLKCARPMPTYATPGLIDHF